MSLYLKEDYILRIYFSEMNGKKFGLTSNSATASFIMWKLYLGKWQSTVWRNNSWIWRMQSYEKWWEWLLPYLFVLQDEYRKPWSL